MDTKVIQDIRSGIDTIKTDHEGRLSLLEKHAFNKTKAALIGGGHGVSLPGVEHYPFSFAKAFLISAMTKEGTISQYKELQECHEAKVMFETTRKALDTGTGGSGGGFVVPQEYGNQIIEMLRPSSGLLGLGVTVLPNLKGSPVHLPKQLTSGTIGWYGQNSTINTADASFGALLLTPKIAGMRCVFSNLLNILSNPAIETLIRRDFARVLAVEIDRVILEGSGASNQPLGIANMSGVQTFAIGTNGGNFGWDQATDFFGVLEDLNVPNDKMGIAWHPKVKRLLKKSKVAQYSGDTAGAYTVAPFMSDAKLKETLGVPFTSSTQITTALTKGSGTSLSRVYGADWSEVILGMWGSMEILATNIGGNAWATNSTEVRLIHNLDVHARHVESIVICSDAKTS